MQKGAALAGAIAVIAAAVYALGLHEKYFPGSPPPPAPTQEELQAKLLQDCEAREVGLRKELADAPESGRVIAKLAQSLLETNGSQFVPTAERLDEGRALVQRAVALAPENVSTLLAQVSLELADHDRFKGSTQSDGRDNFEVYAARTAAQVKEIHDTCDAAKVPAHIL